MSKNNRKLVFNKIAKISFILIKMLVLPTETVFFSGVILLVAVGATSIRRIPLEVTIGPLPETVGYILVAIAVSGLVGVVTRMIPSIWAAAKGANRLIHKFPWKKNQSQITSTSLE